jgi:hypothetical protein
MRLLPGGELASLSVDLVNELEKHGLKAKLFGGMAFCLQVDFMDLFGRDRLTKDIDLVVSRRQIFIAVERMAELGWSAKIGSLLFSDGRKVELAHGGSGIDADLYQDPMVLNHKIRIGSRLLLSGPTLSPADLLLTKLQIENVGERDLIDIGALFLGYAGKAVDIEFDRVVECTSRSWGLHITALRNLSLAQEHLPSMKYVGALIEPARQGIELLRQLMLGADKGITWHLRSLIGKRLRWYSEMS